VQQAKVFKEVMGVTGLVLTKLDGTAKGGAIISIRRELGLPVRFIGVGEGMDDLQPFDPDAFVEAIFGEE
jgi:fused signal recognition particle receptor